MGDNITKFTPKMVNDTEADDMEKLLKKAAIAGLLAFLTTMVTGLTAYNNEM